MGRRLTKAEIQNDLDANGRLIYLVRYAGNVRGRSDLRCLVCNYEWSTPMFNIRSGCGCPACANFVRLTPERIQNDLDADNRQIQLVNYGGATKAHSDFKCLVCNYEWSSAANNVRKGHGCPDCANNVVLTPKQIQNDLDAGDRQIELVRYSGTANTHSDYRCLVCNCEWSSKTSNIRSGHGCPDCAGHNGERTAITIINQYGIDYEYDKRLNQRDYQQELPPYNGRPDFQLFLSTQTTWLEIDGEQHYKYVPFFHRNGIEDFHKRQQLDDKRNRLALSLGVPIIRINYHQLYRKDGLFEQAIAGILETVCSQFIPVDVYLIDQNNLTLI